MHRCEVQADELGPLLLGQLSPSQARRVARQVAACPLCAREAAVLAPVVQALRAYPPPEQVVHGARGDAVAAPTGPSGLGTVLAGVRLERARRRRRRTLIAAAAAVAVLGLGTPVVLALNGPDDAPPDVAVQLTGPSGASGQATLDERRWGTAIRLEVSGLDPDARYGVWLATGTGRRLQAGSFSPTASGTTDLQLSTALPLSDSRVVGVSRLPEAPTAEAVDVMEARLTA